MKVSNILGGHTLRTAVGITLLVLMLSIFPSIASASGYILPGNYSSHLISSEFVSPTNAVSADIDGDNDEDVISVNVSVLTWFENNGSGSGWNEHIIDDTQIYLDWGGPINPSIGDIDNDGDIDIVVGADDGTIWNDMHVINSIYIYKNNGAGIFSKYYIDTLSGDSNGGWITSSSIVDLDKDGHKDIIVTRDPAIVDTSPGYVYWYRNDGLNFTQQTLFYGGGRIHNAKVTDLNRDKFNDIVVSSSQEDYIGYGRLFYLKNDGTQNFTLIDIEPLSIMQVSPIDIFDMDSDGDLDVIAGDSQGRSPDPLNWYENNGTGEFTKHIINADLVSSLIKANDIDGDGDGDIVAQHYDPNDILRFNEILVFENVGNGFIKHILSNGSILDDPKGFDIGDIDGNGWKDIVATGRKNNVIRWFEVVTPPLIISITTDKEIYTPGQAVKLNLKTTNPTTNTYTSSLTLSVTWPSGDSMNILAKNITLSPGSRQIKVPSYRIPDNIFVANGKYKFEAIVTYGGGTERNETTFMISR